METYYEAKAGWRNMENNGTRIIGTRDGARDSDAKFTRTLAPGEESDTSTILVYLPNKTIEKELNNRIRAVRDNIDSPRTLLILKNAILTELELYGVESSGSKEGNLSTDAVFVKSLLSNAEFREKIVGMLISTTPNLWDDDWYHAWNKDAEPMYSERQQRIMRRRSLISFWTKEWDTLSADQVNLALQVARSWP